MYMLEHKPRHYFKQTVMYSSAVVAANFLHWIFSFVARRLTGNETFAIIGVFASLSSLFGLFAGTISQALERYLPFYLSAGRYAHAHALKRLFAWLSVAVGGFITIVLLVAYNEVATYMRIYPELLVVLFAPSLFIFFLISYLRGVLKAFLRFDVIGAMMIIEGLAKTATLAVAVYFGISLVWIAALSITVSLLASLVFGYIALRVLSYEKELKHRANGESVVLPKKEVALYATNALFDDIGLGLLLNIDVLLVNRFFSSYDTGTYATLVFFGKILFLSGSMIAPLVLPITASVLGKGKDGRREFLILLGCVAMAGGGVVAAFAILPDFFIHFFGGEHGFIARPYIPYYFAGMWCLLMARSFSSYFQARKDFVISRLMIAGAGALAVLVYFWHDNLMQVVYCVAGVGSSLLLAAICYYVTDYARVLRRSARA